MGFNSAFKGLKQTWTFSFVVKCRMAGLWTGRSRNRVFISGWDNRTFSSSKCPAM